MRSSGRERDSRFHGCRAWAIISLLVVFMSLPVGATAAWYDIHWQYRKEIAIDSSKVTADLTNFPVLIDLLDPDLDDDAQFDGDDILFTAADGTTKLSHEIELFRGATGRLIAWVKIPNLSSSVSTRIYMYYGNRNAPNQEDETNVWDANFRGVWHLHDDFLDSTPNSNDGWNSGSNDNAAKIADGQDFDGWNDYLDVGSDPSVDNVFNGGGTYSAWIYPQGWGENNYGRVGDKTSDFGASNGWSLQLDNGAPANVRTIRFERAHTITRGDWEAPTDAITLNTWQYVVVTYDDGSTLNDASIYINGIPQTITEVTTPAGSSESDALRSLRIGNRTGATDRTFDGLIDEVRISSTERSSDWIQTEYNNQNDPAGFSSPDVEEIGNYDPTIAAAIADTTVVEDSAPIDNYRDLNDVFTDIEEGSALSFSIQSNSNPSLVNVAIDADSALDLSFAPDQNGSATIVIRATDMGALYVDDTFVITVTPLNDAPTVVAAIADTTVVEDFAPLDNYQDLNDVFSDIEDGSALSFTVDSNSNPSLLNVAIDADSALDLSLAAEQSGVATIVIRATDSGSLFVEDTFVVTVTAENDTPIVASAIADTTVAEDSPPIDNYRDLNDVFSDIEEGGALSFSIEGNSDPALMSVAIDADSALDLSFVPDQNGSATIVIRATDSGALFVEDTFVVMVSAENDPPTVAAAIADTTVVEDSPLIDNYRDLNAVFTDIEEGGALSFSIQSNSNPSLVNVVIDADSALDLSFVPDQNGSATIVIRATDSGSLFVEDTLAVTVTPLNDVPEVASAIADTTVAEDSPLIDNYRDLNDVFTDIEEGGALSFSIQGNSNPALMSVVIDADSALDLSFMPDQNGSATIVIRATDSGSLFVEDTFVVTVSAENDPPIVAAAIADTTVAEDSPLIDNYRDLNVVFTDIEEGGALSFTVESNSNPALMSVVIDADSALDLSFMPDQNGSATIVIRATDSGSLFVEDTFVVTVSAENDPPTVASAIADTTVAEDSPLIDNYRDLNVVFTDIEEGGALSFTVENNSNPALMSVVIDADSALDLSFMPDQNGSATMVIRATDSGSLFVEDTFVVTVSAENDPPIVAAAIADTTVAEDSPLIDNYRDLNVVFTDIEEGGALSFTVEGNSNPSLVNVAIDADSALDLSFGPDQSGNATIVIRATDSGSLFVEDTFIVTTGSDILVAATRVWGIPVHPGDSPTPMFRVGLTNTTASPETLTTIAFTNTSIGPGNQAQLDGNFTPLALSAENGASILPGGVPGSSVASFSSGSLIFSNLEAEIPAGETLILIVEGGASLGARDGDVLDFALSASTDLTFTNPVFLSADWPIDPDDTFPVDGMVAQQITRYAVAPSSFVSGSTYNLALDVKLPANGYDTDTLNRLNVMNLGSALDSLDIASVEAWADNGDDILDVGMDTSLGVFSYTGARWELTGLSYGVPLAGIRIFITVDISETASEGRTIRLSLPALPDVAIGMSSGNDGPIDVAVSNPFVQSISSSERIVFSATPLPPGVVHPGEYDVLLLHLVATNNYDVLKQITRLTLNNGTSTGGSASQNDLDNEIETLKLRIDANDNGVLDDVATDPVVGAAFFDNGKATFTGLLWDLPAGLSRHVFITADVSLSEARDGDVLGASVISGLDVEFADATAVIGNWPLDSYPQLSVDGMLAAQITVQDITAATLAPGDGPILAMDLIIPGNGYADDVLHGIEVVNLGSAEETDISDLRLWRDGGDGQFSAGGGDDVEIAPFVWTSGAWRSPVLSEPVTATGMRVYVGLTVAGASTDSVTVRLAVPISGLSVESDNDGPIDTAVESAQSLLLSHAPLLISLIADPGTSTTGQNVTVRMVVQNVGGEQVNNISPSSLTTAGDAGFNIQSGPQPASLDLAQGAVDTFTWVYASVSQGTAQWIGNCEGTGAISGLIRGALVAASNTHRVFDEAGDLALFPIESMPFLINRGQTDVVPLSLTFSASGGSEVSNTRVRRLRVRLQDDQGGGIVPSELLTRVIVSEGNTTYLAKTNLEMTGAEIDLTLATPVVISTVEPVTLSIRLDISASTLIPNFLLHIQDASWFEAEDAISGAPVTVVLQEGSFPIQSGLGYLVVPPTELDVSSTPSATQRVGWGQRDVSLLTLQLENPGVVGLTTDIVVASMLVSVTDTNGVAIPEPSQLFERISVSSPLGGTYADRALDGQDSTSFGLTLSPLARVAVDTPLELILSADIAAGANVGACRLQLIDSARFDARDANTSVRIPVIFQSDPLEGGIIVIETPAESLCVKGTAEFPPTINVGEEDVAAFTISLRHAAQPGVGRIQINELTVQCQNDLRNPLVPATYIDRLQVFQDVTEIGNLTDIPTSGNQITVPLPGLLLEPGDSVGLELRIDVSATAPESFLELLVEGYDVEATDANIGAGIIVVEDIGGNLPITSGLTRLLAPPTELVVGLDSRMPAALVAGETDVELATLSMANTATTGSGPITVEYMVLQAADQSFTMVPIGAVVTQVKFYVGAQLAGESDSLVVDSTTAYVPLVAPIVLSPEEKHEIEIRADLREDIGVESFRIGFSSDDVGVVQPGSAILQIRVEPEAGQTFPVWTEAGNFGASTLKESFSNFPNPFAAGNELTTFVYYLPTDGKVSLKIWTVRGEAVTTIRAQSQRSAGLYQDDRWNGRNDLSSVVVNGVYLAELIVEYNSGSQERLLRKVAVVR